MNAEFEIKSGLSSLRKRLKNLGPGLVTGAADDDPSGIATYSQVGAQFGYALGWTLTLAFPLMVAVQLIFAHLGRATGQGVAAALCRHYPSWLVKGLVFLVGLANTINIGANLRAMGDASRLILGGPVWAHSLLFGVVCATAAVFLDYKRYVRALKVLTLSLLAYLGTLLMVDMDWLAALQQLVVPTLTFRADYAIAVVAVFGTTISPYLFFWQAGEEVERVENGSRRQPIAIAPQQAERARRRIRLDTVIGMAFSNVVALAIIFCAAATLHVQGVSDIGSSADVAAMLSPFAGEWAEYLFASGIIATGLLSVPVLAGSAASALGEAFNCPVGFSRRWFQARLFYGVALGSMTAGIIMSWLPINPIDALYWSAVVNGIVAVPVLAMTMWLVSRHSILADFPVSRWMTGLGWTTTVIMTLAALAMFAL